MNSHKITEALLPEYRKWIQVEVLDSIDSTNSYVLQNARVGLIKKGHVCLAEQQTKGRATKGKSWFSPYGKSIYCSLLWQMAYGRRLGLSLAVGVILVQAMRVYGVDSGLQLKWPNDIWYANRKLAGILIETSRDQVVIGFGLNVDFSQEPGASSNWIALQEIMQKSPERNTLTGLLINALCAELPRYEAQGLQPFLPVWSQYDVLRGKSVTVRIGDNLIQGFVEGVTAQGELILVDRSGQTHLLLSGDIIW